MMKSPRLPLIALTFTVVTAGCAGEEAYDPSAEACEHTQDGPAAAATASELDDATAPDISAEHTRHDVTFVAVDGGNGGFAHFESAGGEHIVFLTKDVPLAFAAADGSAIDLEESVPETSCPEVVVAKHVVFPVGITSLSFGPTTETAISIVIEAAGEHEEHAE